MIYEEQVKYIKANHRYPGKKVSSMLKTVGRLLFSILALGLSISTFYLFFTTDQFDKFNKLILIFVAIIFYYGLAILFSLKNEWTSDKYFEEIITDKPVVENLKIASNILNKNFKIKFIDVDDKNYVIVAQTKISWLTWGDIITLVCDNNRMLVNSRASGQQFFSYGQEKRNVEKIKNALLD